MARSRSRDYDTRRFSKKIAGWGRYGTKHRPAGLREVAPGTFRVEDLARALDSTEDWVLEVVQKHALHEDDRSERFTISSDKRGSFQVLVHPKRAYWEKAAPSRRSAWRDPTPGSSSCRSAAGLDHGPFGMCRNMSVRERLNSSLGVGASSGSGSRISTQAKLSMSLDEVAAAEARASREICSSRQVEPARWQSRPHFGGLSTPRMGTEEALRTAPWRTEPQVLQSLGFRPGEVIKLEDESDEEQEEAEAAAKALVSQLQSAGLNRGRHRSDMSSDSD